MPPRLLTAVAFGGILIRLFVVVSGGNQIFGRLSGAGDAPAYTILAANIYAGKGFSYVGYPSAFRPPLYPMLLAGLHFLVGPYYLLGMRVVQLIAGILTAWLCAVVARRLWEPQAAFRAFALVMIFPTLVFFTGEILTESFAALLTACFLYFLIRAAEEQLSNYWGMGITAGIAALLRFNMIFLPFIAASGSLLNSSKNTRRWNRILIVTIVPSMIILPWVVRNLLVFRGQVFYSTHTGIDLVEGIIEPEGRANEEQQQLIIKEAGWVMQGLERDDARRLFYPSEPELNQMAMRAAIRLWRQSIPNDVCLMARKLAYFWLSTDQLNGLGKFTYRVKVIRFAGILFYWFSLALAAVGMWKLFQKDTHLALALLLYVSVATCLHLFFAMNTRLRAPLIDPLLCILCSFPLLSSVPDSP